jgi:hypothetical protein
VNLLVAIDPGVSGAVAWAVAGDVQRPTWRRDPANDPGVAALLAEIVQQAHVSRCRAIYTVLECPGARGGRRRRREEPLSPMDLYAMASNIQRWRTATYMTGLDAELWRPPDWMDLFPGLPRGNDPKSYRERKKEVARRMRTAYPGLRFPESAADALAILFVMQKVRGVTGRARPVPEGPIFQGHDPYRGLMK